MLIPEAGLSWWEGSHSPWNHWLSKKAPNPIAPAASVKRWISGEDCVKGGRKRLTPFHFSRKNCHIRISFVNSGVRYNFLFGEESPRVRLMIRCMKGRPGEITRQANCRVPMRDWRSRRWQVCFEAQEASKERAWQSLSNGSLASIRTESRVIPINSRTWVGRKVLCGARGTFNSSKRVRTLQRAVAQTEDGGGWAMKKSSKMWIIEGMFKWFLTTHSRASENWLKR